MTKIASAAALLHEAVLDLYAGKSAQADRLPAIAASVSDAALRQVLEVETALAREQADAMAAAATVDGASANLWMAGILDDAERDTRQTQPGRLLDIAVTGAIRKAKAAEIVSSETAIALAEAVGSAAIASLVRSHRDAEIATDRALKACLVALARAS